MVTNVIGVDVGRYGALVSLSDVNNYLLMPMGDTQAGVYLRGIDRWRLSKVGGLDVVCIEHQWTFGREGRVSVANLMLQYGQLLGYFSGYETYAIPVSYWKKHHGIGGGDEGKQQAVDLVSEMYPDLNWPKRKPHRHGLADAILIAKYGVSPAVLSPTKRSKK